MGSFVNKRLFQGFICLHILHHAANGPIFGSWMIEELAGHGYRMSPGTLYPILHHLAKEVLLEQKSENIQGKIRKYYQLTAAGAMELTNAKRYLKELVGEIGLEDTDSHV